MTRVLPTAAMADEVAERDRLAWNLPSPGASATSLDAPTPAARGRLAAVPALDAIVEHDLDWQGFRSRYYPGGRRHDFEALIAYGVYRSSGGVVDVRSAGEVERLRGPVLVSPVPTATDSWEDEGGATR